LVEEYVFAVAALCREVFEVAVPVDAVFLAELLPELLPDAVAALAGLQRYDLSVDLSAYAHMHYIVLSLVLQTSGIGFSCAAIQAIVVGTRFE
jgi:hypothetical protein